MLNDFQISPFWPWPVDTLLTLHLCNICCFLSVSFILTASGQWLRHHWSCARRTLDTASSRHTLFTHNVTQTDVITNRIAMMPFYICQQLCTLHVFWCERKTQNSSSMRRRLLLSLNGHYIIVCTIAVHVYLMLTSIIGEKLPSG